MSEIIHREVIGSANPVAKFFRSLVASIKGIAIGILFIIISFVLLWFAANQKEHSKVIEALPLQTPEEVSGNTGMVKISGVPSYSNVLVAPNTETEVLYYTYLEEEYAIRRVEKTRTVTEDGQEIRETYVEYEPSWETKESRTDWSEFKIGQIAIGPEKATLQMNTETLYTNTEDLEYDSWYDDEDLVDVPQKKRVTVSGVDSDVEIIVVGQVSGDRISSGEEGTFFISNMSDSEFLEAQVSSEKTAFWIMVIGTWFLMTLGFTMLLGPITKLLDIIPGVGGLVNTLLFIIFGIVSAVIVFFAYVGMKYWWAILLIVIAVVGFLVYSKIKKHPEDIKPLPENK